MEIDDSDDVVMLGNHTAAAAHPMFTFKGDTATRLLRNESIQVDAHLGHQNDMLQVRIIPLGSIASFRANVTAFGTSYDMG